MVYTQTILEENLAVDMHNWRWYNEERSIRKSKRA